MNRLYPALSIYDDKKKKQQEIRHIFSAIGLCGCGTGAHYKIVSDMLERAAAKGCFYDPLGDITGEVVEFIAHVMGSDQWDLLDHGSSIGFAWLTPKGEVLRKFFQDFGVDENKWPEWWCSCSADEEW